MSKEDIVYRKGHFHNIDRSIINKPYKSDIEDTAGFGDTLKSALNGGESGTDSVANVMGAYFNQLGASNTLSNTSGNTANSIVSQGLTKLQGSGVGGKVGGGFSNVLNSMGNTGSIGKIAGVAGKAGAASFLSTGVNAADAFKYASALKDTSELKENINAARNNSSNATTLDQLQNDADKQSVFSKINHGNLKAHSGWQVAGHTLKNMGKTFVTAKGGLISKLIQTAIVGGAGGAGAIAGNQKAVNQAALLNYQQNDAQLAQNIGLLNAQNQIAHNAYGSEMLDTAIGAFGGPLSFKKMDDNSFAYGGDMQFTGDFSNGVTKVDVGGTHEQNPLEGVPMGADEQGTPNLVEEGEIIYDNYVYSNRLIPTEKQLIKAMLPSKYKNYTYAKIAEELSKDTEERPNDPISLKTLKANMSRLREIQEETRTNKQEKEAKKQFNKLSPEQQQTLIQNAQQRFMQQGQQQSGPEEQQIQQQMAQEQIPQPFAFGGNIYSGTNSTTTGNQYLPGVKPFEFGAYDLSLPFDNRTVEQKKLDLIEKNAEFQNFKFPDYTQAVSTTPDYSKYFPTFDIRTPIPKKDSADSRVIAENSAPQYQTWLRYAPVVGSAFSVMNDIFGDAKPDYTLANKVMAEVNNISSPRFAPVGQRLTYKPIDRNYTLNQQAAAAAATRNAIINSGANPAAIRAALLSSGYNTQNSVGNTLMQMDQYNAQQQQKAAEFNRATDEFNSEGQLRADTAALDAARARIAGIDEVAKLSQAERDRYLSSRSANLTNLFNNLGAVGKENMAFNMANSNRSQYYGMTRGGNMYYKPAYYNLSAEDRKKVDNAFGILGVIPDSENTGSAFGGYLTVKKKSKK